MKKIVITGMGAITPVGIGVDEYWKNIVAGKSGIDTIKSFDPSELAVQIAGEIKDFTPTDYLEKDLVRKTDPFMQYAYIASEEAIRQSDGHRDGRHCHDRLHAGRAVRRVAQKGRSPIYS